jgi:Ca-activated chloride channel family protein
VRTRALIATLIVCVVTLSGSAQERGALRGVVQDPAGGPIPGATVTLTGAEQRTTITNERGEFSFVSLLPGTYRVTAALVGFSTAALDARIVSGRASRIVMTLQVASLSESVAVSGSSQPIERRERSEHVAPDREQYASRSENGFRQVARAPLSTFSIDVDTASYSNVRRFLNDGKLPPADAVRTEELINYFRYDYPDPSPDVPLSVATELAACPWNPKHHLALIGIQARDLPEAAVPPRNLVFLVDVSGSMDEPDKLPLVKTALRTLTAALRRQDRVGIVVYAGASGVALESTAGDQKEAIHAAIAELRPGGSTNGGAGIQLAYQIARQHFRKDGINRVVLATDGDFNVGLTSEKALLRLIESERKSGVFLSVLGVGTGNLQDATMEMLADHGNGNYAYLDSVQEVRKVLHRQAGATLVTLAKDVKIQVEFNPAMVAAYRLVGYENRLLNDEDFNDDTKDAGEIGAGHSVTALYEIVPVGEGPVVDPLKYQPVAPRAPSTSASEVATVKVRYQPASGGRSRLVTTVVQSRPGAMSENLGFASAVAEVGMLLSRSRHAADATYDAAIARARKFRGADLHGDRMEFIRLADVAATLQSLETPARVQR